MTPAATAISPSTASDLLRVLADRGHRPTCAASRSISCWSASVFATFEQLVEALGLELVAQPVDGLRPRLRVAGLEGRRAGVDLRAAAAAPAGLVRRSGDSCVSHGFVASSGGRFAGRGGLAPISGSGVVANTPGAQRDEVLAAGGQHAEPRAVGVGRAALAREARQRLGRLLVDLALGGELLVGHRVHRPRVDDGRSGSSTRGGPGGRAGCCGRSAAARSGTVGRRSAARPRSSGSDTRPRSCCTNGSETSSVSSELWTPGRSSLASERSGGNDSLSACSAGIEAFSVFGSSPTAVRRFASWTREGVRGGVEVGDQRLERARGCGRARRRSRPAFFT